MCTYVTHDTNIQGSGYAAGAWIDVRRAIVSFDHPETIALEHALCIDLRSDNGDPASRIALELDGDSARRLAAAILDALHEGERDG